MAVNNPVSSLPPPSTTTPLPTSSGQDHQNYDLPDATETETGTKVATGMAIGMGIGMGEEMGAGMGKGKGIGIGISKGDTVALGSSSSPSLGRQPTAVSAPHQTRPRHTVTFLAGRTPALSLDTCMAGL